MAKKNENSLETYVRQLEQSFRQWESLYTNGGYDPSYADGVNLNLVRNHILSWKRQIEEYISSSKEELSLFTTEYPDIYYKETPPEVPMDYMARANEIRAYAKEQLALYEQDPNFCYIRDHHKDAFPTGETKSTKAAGLSIWSTTGFTRFRRIVEEDNLVYMRSYFYEPYEKKAPDWARKAQALKDYLAADHSKDDMTPVRETFDDEELSDEDPEIVEEHPESTQARKLALDEQIKKASERSAAPAGKDKDREREKDEQLSLF